MDLSSQATKPHLRRSYVLALCLCAQRALAETTEGSASEEKAFDQQVLDAVKNPSAPESFKILLGLGLAIAVVTGLAITAWSSCKKEDTLRVTLDDVDDGS